MSNKISLCSAKNNLTIRFAILDAQVSNLYYRNEKGLPDGLYFRLFTEESLFATYEELIKYCKFIFVNSVGIYHSENDSYSGGYGLIQQSEADAFGRISDYNLKDKFYFSGCVFSANNFATQTINRETNNTINSLEYLAKFLVPSIEFDLLLIGSLIFYFGFLYLVTKFKLISKFVLKLLSLLFVIFLFFIHNLYNLNLNTDNLIVNTSNLLTTIDDVFETNKELCLIEKSSADNDFFYNAPEHSLASKLNKKINHNNLCYLYDPGTNNLGNIIERDQNRIFIFTFDLGRYYIVKYIQTVFKRDVFVSQKSIFENLRTLILSKKVSKKIRNLVNKWSYILLENGIVAIRKKLPDPGLSLVKFGEFAFYDNLESYISDFTVTTAISFNRLDALFKIYFGILILLFLIFLIHHLINYYLIYLKYFVRKLKFRLINYLNRFVRIMKKFIIIIIRKSIKLLKR